MATKNATMALSTAQAKAIAKDQEVRFPRKDNGWVVFGNARLCRLPKRMRKSGRNAKAYRLTAKHHDHLAPVLAIASENGKVACIVYRTEED